jgi:hypothetical protein
MPKERVKKDYLTEILTGYLLEEGKARDRKQDGKKAVLDLCKNVVYDVETGRTDFVGDLVSKYVAIRHRTTTCIHTYITHNTYI